MVLNKRTIESRLQFLKETLDKLRQLQKISRDDFVARHDHYWLGEHGLHLAAEAVFDIGNHILVGHFGERAAGYDLVMERLKEKGVLQPETVHRFARIGGFRNILVHEYMEIDRDKVYERLQNGLDDFQTFAKEILTWLEKPIQK